MERVEHSDLLFYVSGCWRQAEERKRMQRRRYPYSVWFTSLLQQVPRKVVDDRDTGLFYLENMVLIPLIEWEIFFKTTLV